MSEDADYDAQVQKDFEEQEERDRIEDLLKETELITKTEIIPTEAPPVRKLPNKKKTSKAKALKLIVKRTNDSVSMVIQASPEEIMRAFADKYKLVLEVGDVMLIGGNPYITKSGLLRLSHIQEVKSVMPKQKMVDYDKKRAHYECIVTTADDRVYRDEGYCEISEGGKKNMHSVIGTAITRARNRALAAATATPHCSYEELDSQYKENAIDITEYQEEGD